MKLIAALAFSLIALAACERAAAPVADEPPPAIEAPPPPPASPPVDAALLAAPDSAFVAVEPTELGVIGAPTIHEALGPLVQSDAHVDHEALVAEGEDEQESLQVSVRETGDDAVADIVRSGLLDDSVAAAHLRITFRREAEGWYPVNGYRRMQCRRGASAGQWSASPCP